MKLIWTDVFQIHAKRVPGVWTPRMHFVAFVKTVLKVSIVKLFSASTDFIFACTSWLRCTLSIEYSIWLLYFLAKDARSVAVLNVGEWIPQHELKSKDTTRFNSHITALRKAWIHLFCLQQWANTKMSQKFCNILVTYCTTHRLLQYYQSCNIRATNVPKFFDWT